MIKKDDGRVIFEGDAEVEHRKFRAYRPWPGSFCLWERKRIKVIEAENKFEIRNTKQIQNTKYKIQNRKQGEVFLDSEGNLCLQFTQGYWIVKKLQLEGKKDMKTAEFLNGYRQILSSMLE